MSRISHERLLELVEYDPEIVSFRWRQVAGPSGSIQAGTPLAVRTADGGRYVSVERRSYRVSTLVWFYHHGKWPLERLMPIDGDYANDRIENLTLVSGAKSAGVMFKGLKSTKELTADIVRNLFDYRPSGELIWRRKVGSSTRVGRSAGAGGNHGHWQISLAGKDYLRGRLVWLHVNGTWPRAKLVHVNGNKIDDRIENLAEGAFTHGDFDMRTKEGRNQYTKAHRQNHRAMYRNQELRRNFGITLDDYSRMQVEQNGVCAICHKPETMRRWGANTPLAVDHDHATGAVRGLLCDSCNRALGYFKDTEATLYSAIEYLRKARGYVLPPPEKRSAYAGYH